jgi:hypothetical protein
MTHRALDDRAGQRFTRVFLLVVLSGLAGAAAIAIAIDPTHTFGTGQVPSVLTGERDTKPAAFRALEPAARAVVLGSSRVMKLRPACVQELTGLPTFNFGLSSAIMEDLVAAFRFARAHSKAPLGELIIGVDVEAFDNHAEPDQRLRSAVELRAYVDGPTGLSFDAATRTLFGWQTLRLAALSLWYQLRPGARPPARVSYAPDGFITYNVLEAEIRAGTFSRKKHYADMVAKLRDVRGTKEYTALSEPRVQAFRDLIATAHRDGTRIDVVIPPIAAEMEPARDAGRFAARRRDLDALLGELERAGMIHYLRVTRIEELGGDPTGFFDGAHMTEANSARVLLAMFHKDRGCGIGSAAAQHD